ncbi:MAG TPA: DNA-binding domain-containing protein [Dyella sp.]|nr:DNA-binding domain-containing protein [Dyella sp.]
MLVQMQRDFQAWLIRADDNPSPQEHVRSTRGLAAYQNNYRTQLVNVLRASYPQLQAWLGEETFLAAAIHHINRHPPSSWTLDVYGEDFSRTLQELYPHNPDVHELAWIEWALAAAFVARDAKGAALEHWADVDWDNARLALAPSFRHRIATTNAFAIWSAWQDQVDLPEAEMLDDPAGLIVWRVGFQTQIKQVDAIESDALISLRDDGRFNTLCEMLVEQLDEEQGIARAGRLLAEWTAAGIVTGLL